MVSGKEHQRCESSKKCGSVSNLHASSTRYMNLRPAFPGIIFPELGILQVLSSYLRDPSISQPCEADHRHGCDEDRGWWWKNKYRPHHAHHSVGFFFFLDWKTNSGDLKPSMYIYIKLSSWDKNEWMNDCINNIFPPTFGLLGNQLKRALWTVG